MKNRFNPLDFPTCLLHPKWVAPSHWTEHIPFAFALCEMVRPRVLVELGVFGGSSYCAMCQAIEHLGLPSHAYGVDTWQGDPHNGSNGPEILRDLQEHHDPQYGRFSRLMPSTFDTAVAHFADGSIDLLHIDGYHTYDAVRGDFEQWLPKMSERGVILFHDINVHDLDFGVWKLWGELKTRYRSFEFSHEHGLGVLIVGTECPEPLERLLEAGEEETARIRDFYFQLGQRITQVVRNRRVRIEAKEQIEQSFRQHEARVAEATKQVVARCAETERRCEELDRRRVEVEHQCAVAEQWQQVYRFQVMDRDEIIQQLRKALDGVNVQLQQAVTGYTAEIDRVWNTAVDLENELVAVRSSKAFRSGKWIARAARILAPARSWRRRLLQIGYRSARVVRRQGVLAFFRKALLRAVGRR